MEIKTFDELPLSADMLAILKQAGFVQPTPVQARAIPAALSGKDVVATAQTGTGKTLAFMVPIVERLMAQKPAPKKGVSALILSPTRELAIQIHETFLKIAGRNSGLRAAVVVGGLSEGNQLRDIRRGVQVVIATPGRLVDFLDRKLVQLNATNTLVLDEADRMLDMGFLPSIKRILNALPAERQSLFFSATIEKSVSRLIDEYLHEPVRIAIGPVSKPAEHVNLRLYEVDQENKLDTLREMLATEPGTFLVFARTKHGTDRLAKALAKNGVKAVGIHGDRTQGQRNRALDGFKTGQYRVLVATDVAARGIHVDNIAHVVNYDMPRAPEDFIHRIGRTGRAGERGTASTFTTRLERAEVRKLERALNVRLVKQQISLPTRTPVAV